MSRKGHGSIILGVLTGELYVRVYGIYMLQELLFVGFLDDYTGIIHKPFPHQRGGVVICWWLLSQNFSCTGLPLLGWWESPWQHLQPAHNTGFGKWSKYSWDKIPEDRWYSWLSWMFFLGAQGLLPAIFQWWWGQVGWALRWKVPSHHMILLPHLDPIGCLSGVIGNLHYCVHGEVTFPPGASGSWTVP